VPRESAIKRNQSRHRRVRTRQPRQRARRMDGHTLAGSGGLQTTSLLAAQSDHSNSKKEMPPEARTEALGSGDGADYSSAALLAATAAVQQSNDEGRKAAARLSRLPARSEQSAGRTAIDLSWCFNLRQDHESRSSEEVLEMLDLFDDLDSIPEPVIQSRNWAAVGASGMVCTMGEETCEALVLSRAPTTISEEQPDTTFMPSKA
jgi:hypothetical protein